MAYAQQGKAVLFGTTAQSGTLPTFTLYGPDGNQITGYSTPIVNGLSVNHNATTETITNESGEIVAMISHGEYIECTFDLVPSGTSSANTLAQARASARIPAAGSTLVTAGFDVIAIGPFSDALNVATSGSLPDTARWIYTGNGNVKFSADGHAVLSLQMRRSPQLAGGVAITD